MLGPKIKLKRIILRPAEEKDLAGYVKGLQNPNVIRYMILPKAPTMRQEQEWFEDIKKSKSEIHWAIEYDNQCIGGVSLRGINDFLKTAEMGYLIHEEKYWGQGLMSVAARAIRDYGFEKLDLETMEIDAIKENIGSHKIIVKLGFKKIGAFPHKLFRDGKWHDDTMYVMLKDEWQNEIS